MAGTVPLAAQLDTLAGMISGFLNGCKMHLIGSSITLNSATTLATLIAAESTFTGYAPVALTSWTTPATDGTNAAVSTDVQGQFTGTGVGGTGSVYGYWLSDSADTHFYGAELFTGGPLSAAQNVVFEVDETFSYITRF